MGLVLAQFPVQGQMVVVAQMGKTKAVSEMPRVTPSIIKKGQLVMMSTGSYSDYSVDAVFKVTADFSPDEVVKEFLAIPKPKDSYNHETMWQFLNWIVNEKKVFEEVKTTEWHYADWGDSIDVDLSPLGATYIQYPYQGGDSADH